MSTKKDKFSHKDNFYMNLALDIAKSRHGLTGPNPSVGCVIVKNDKIISIGQTSINGRPHAEFNAINNCPEDLSKAKMYLTLEPCCHKGITPPCTNLIIKSNISEVIYSISDIDKRVNNKSFKILKSNNLKVKKGLLKKEISSFYKPYFFNRKKKLPFVTGKIAISKNMIIYSKLNNKITDIHSDKFTHFLRYKNDSILTTYKTVNKDNPKLNCRLKGFSQFSPKRIILDNKLETKLYNYIIKTASNDNTFIFYNKAKKSKILEFKKRKIKLIKSKLDKSQNFDFKIVLKKLYALGVRNLLIEGGNELTRNLLSKKIFNYFYLYRSPKKISKKNEYLKFESLNILKRKYKIKKNINQNNGKDMITLYKN